MMTEKRQEWDRMLWGSIVKTITADSQNEGYIAEGVLKGMSP